MSDFAFDAAFDELATEDPESRIRGLHESPSKFLLRTNFQTVTPPHTWGLTSSADSRGVTTAERPRTSEPSPPGTCGVPSQIERPGGGHRPGA